MKIKDIKKAIMEKYPDVYNESSFEGNEKLRMKGLSVRIEEMEQELREQLENFLTKGMKPQYTVESWTVDKLMQERGMNELAALLTIDWLVKDPEKAKASLAKGHDSINKFEDIR